MALCQWRIDRALLLELNAFDDDHLDPALLALALRYRTTAARGFYNALSELQKLRDVIHQQKAAESPPHSSFRKTRIPARLHSRKILKRSRKRKRPNLSSLAFI